VKRFVRVVCLMALLAGVFAGAAYALDFNDESEQAPIGEVGKLYHFELHSHGGCDYYPYHYVVESGEIPPGLKLGNLNSKSGLVDGTPTEPGIFRAWIALKDICGNSAELLFTFEIWVRRWGITTQSLKPATVGSPYSVALQGAGVPSTARWEISAGSLPAGLELSKEGAISGTPTAAGSATFTVKATAEATDPAAAGTRTDSKQFTLAVQEPLAPRISRSAGEVGVPFRASFAATGGQGPYTWSASGLPAGLSVTSAGSIAGTPKSAGSYPSQLTLTDANGNTKTLNVTFRVARKVAITTKSLAGATAGSAYADRLEVKGGVRPFRFTIAGGLLLAGLKLDATTGRISGTPRSAGSARVTIRVTDAAGGTSTRTFVQVAA